MTREATVTSHRQPRPSSTAVGRSLRFERGLAVLAGVVALLTGGLALIVGAGWLGDFRADRSVLDPMVVDAVRAAPGITVLVGIAAGVLLVALGLWWISRALRPEARPDMRLEPGTLSTGGLTVSGSALTDAIRTDAESVSGVTRARVRMAGTAQRPNLRLVLSLQEGTNVRQVWEELDDKVLGRAREALGTEVLPTAIRLELDRAPGRRVR
ncbi:alkaline shock response membrane anchor protein AmaP [Allosaccharopolyspora coralli]|uniref:Alkaline shock response membrane anchor protein AmaP n=1 Tax=Allosaccharopolyspora coralli TaxID=2665642 RepID=A0A5Q3Q4Z3_9PSEU|nr:alkaline shock response membrane anchor protein AmaP [Allosaccharopolyspora coralli]QGK69522.1 alkaline shock response membrane anchor protein AmaP [Allosaccharopolyspora coralli]